MRRDRKGEELNRGSSARMLGLFLVLTMLTLAGRTPANAQCFSLTDAVRFALENNHELRAFRDAVAAKKEDIGVARSHLLPKISFEERILRTNNPVYGFMAKLNEQRFATRDLTIDNLNSPGSANDFQTSFSVEQPLFAPKSYVGLDISTREYGAGLVELERKREQISFKVAQAYFMVHTAKANLQVAEKSVEDAREHLRIAKLRYEADLGMYADTLRAGTAVAEARQRKVTAEKNFNLARRMLGLILGLSESADIADETPQVETREADYYTRASLARGDVRSMELRYENARKNILMADADYLPYIGVGGGYQWNDPSNLFGGEGRSWTVMGFLRWNLFDGARREYERSKAKHQEKEAREHLEGMKKAVSYGLYQAQLGVEEAKINVELAREALNTAEEGQRLVRLRYENAFSPIVDLLDAQVVLDRARAGLVTRENEYRISILNLAYESGTILKDLRIESEEKKD